VADVVDRTETTPVAITPQLVQAFIDDFDRNDPVDRFVARRLIEKLQGEIYRREREHYPEWIDVGGEA
jgi:hypothetical protein